MIQLSWVLSGNALCVQPPSEESLPEPVSPVLPPRAPWPGLKTMQPVAKDHHQCPPHFVQTPFTDTVSNQASWFDEITEGLGIFQVLEGWS